MKKLTAGIFAGILSVVAVGAARADIASTTYVDGAHNHAITAATTAVANGTVTALKASQDADGNVISSTYQKAALVTEKDNVTSEMLGSTTTYPSMATMNAVVSEAASKASGDLSTLSESVTANTTEIAAINNATTGIEAKAKAYTDALANGAVKTNTDNIATLNGNATTEGSVAYKIAAAVNTINATTEGLDGRLDVIEGEGAGSIKKALADAKEYADGLNTTMDARVDALEADNTTNKSDISGLQSGKQTKLTADNLKGADNVSVAIAEDGVITVTGNAAGAVASGDDKAVTGGAVYNAIENAKTAAAETAQGKVDALANGAVKTNTDKIGNTAMGTTATTLTGAIKELKDAVGSASVKDQIGEVVGELPDEQTVANVLATKVDKDAALANKLLTTTSTGVLKDASDGVTVPAGCKEDKSNCMLISNGNSFRWEVIVDTYPGATTSE